MKLTKHNNTLDTNVETENQNFGIGDVSVVIEILRNRLYKHKVRTLVQEYISNGRDASREVGSKKLIKIVAPTVFDPTFKVRDYGPGISPDRMKKVFVMYGSSTKRDSNNQTGGFGIGAKSAWSYTDSFTIVTYIDGVKRTYLAHTGVNNNGRLDFLGETATKEPNGTEIQIGVSKNDIKEFTLAIRRAIHFWTEEANVTGMDLVKSDLERGLRVKDFEVISGNAVGDYNLGGWNRKVALAIDGILYPVDRDIYEKTLNTDIINGVLIVHVDVGIIDVSASREEIAISPENTKKLNDLFRKANQELDSYIQKELNSVKKIQDKIKKFVELSESFYITFDDGIYKIDTRGKFSTDLFDQVDIIRYNNRRGKLRKTFINDTTKSKNFSTKQIELKNLYFFDNSESLVKKNHRIREFLKTNDSIIVMQLKDSSKSVYNKLIKELLFKDLKTVSYTETPKTQSVRVKRRHQVFCVHSLCRWGGVEKFHTTLADNDNVWYYVEMNGNSFPQNKSDLKDVAKYLNISVCGLSKSSVLKVKGDKKFRCFNTYIKTLKPNKDQIKQIQYNLSKNKIAFYKWIDIDTIENKHLKFMSKQYEGFAGLFSSIVPLLLKSWTEHEKVIKFMRLDKEVTNLLDECKLLKYMTFIKVDKVETTFYINCKLSKGDK